MIAPPTSDDELLSRCQSIEGLTLGQLASKLGLSVPLDPLKRKGWFGQAVELALGASAGSRALPDFFKLGIELKTLPINTLGASAESTFVTTIPLLTIHKQTWETSTCHHKLKRVLWLPFEASTTITFVHRRIGRAILWSPTTEQEAILAEDWNMLTLMIATGRLADIDASIGQWLQIRPKGASSRSLCFGFDDRGNKVLTLPRGFYLRSMFTTMIFQGVNG